MTKEQFLKELRANLKHLPAPEVEEIVRDQEEYIREAVQAGRTEDQVIQSLGDPKSFAAGIGVDLKIQQAVNSPRLKDQAAITLRAVFALLALAPLNLIFVLGPFMGLCGFMLGMWCAVAALEIVAVAIFCLFLFKLIFIPVGIMLHLSALFFALGLIGAGIILFCLMLEATRYIFLGTLAYLKWNLSFVKNQI